MRVLVIGGSGFIGSHVVAALVAEGHEVAALTRGNRPNRATVAITGDRKRLAESRDAIRAFAPEVAVDMIAGSAAQARALVAELEGVAKRTVVASSMDVYRACGVFHGIEDGELEPLPLTEDSALRTQLHTYPPQRIAVLQQVFGWLDDEYDKIPVEQIARELDATILRLPMVYGPGDPLRRLYPILRRIADGRRALILSDAVATWRASRGYVEDVARAIALAVANDAATGRTYNVADPDAPSELEWTRRTIEAAGWDGELVVLPDADTPRHVRPPGKVAQHWIADSTRIRTELGYREMIDRDEALRRTIAWERATPATGFVPYVFDYAAEDAALARR